MNVNYARIPAKGREATAVSMNASFNQTVPYLVERMHGFSIVADVVETSAALAGTLKLQASNNAFADNTSMEPNVVTTPVWVDIPASSVTLTTGSTQVVWNIADVYYEAVRVVWTRSSGQGTFTPYYLAKGV